MTHFQNIYQEALAGKKNLNIEKKDFGNILADFVISRFWKSEKTDSKIFRNQ